MPLSSNIPAIGFIHAWALCAIFAFLCPQKLSDFDVSDQKKMTTQVVAYFIYSLYMLLCGFILHFFI